MIAKALLLGVLTVTSYRPVPEQTKPECTSREHCRTSIDDNVNMFGVAVSQDLLKSGKVNYGDVLYVPGYGYRIVDDAMGPRAKRQIDLLVFTKAQEKAVGVRHKAVYVIQTLEGLPGLGDKQ